MNTSSRSLLTPPATVLKPSVRKDLLVVGAVTLLTFMLSSVLELNELLEHWTRPHEAYQLDELPVTFLAMAAALAWFSWRRSRQALEQVALRIATQRALVDSEEQYRMLFMENLSANLVATPDGVVKLANPAAAELLGFGTAQDLKDRRLADFYAERSLWEAHRERLLRGDRIELPVLQLQRRDGTLAQAVAKLSARLSPSREPELHVYVTDITEVTLMQAELALAFEENRRLSQRSMQVQEEERRNLARELHDEMGQSLNAIKVDAVTIRDHGTATSDIRRSAEAIVEVSSQVYDLVRSITQRLRPVALDELGLRSAVEYGIDQWQRRHPAVRCTFEARGELDDLGEQVNITLYRLVQECLTNVVKHASANNVSISISRDSNPASGEDELRLRFEDDGRGFDTTTRKQGLGLAGLRERVEVLAGHFELESTPGRGVRIEAVIPAKGVSG